MGNAVAFDTYAYVRKLRDAGMDEAQAAIQAEALVDLMENRLATKQDVVDLKRDMDDKIDTAETNLKRDMDGKFKEMDGKLEKLELRMTIKMGGMILASVGMIIGGLRGFSAPAQPVYQPPAQEMRQTAPVPPVAAQPPAR